MLWIPVACLALGIVRCVDRFVVRGLFAGNFMKFFRVNDCYSVINGEYTEQLNRAFEIYVQELCESVGIEIDSRFSGIAESIS